MRDRNFEWLRKRVFLRPQFMHSSIVPAFDEGEVGSPKTFTEGELFQEPRSLDPELGESVLSEVSTFGLVGLGFRIAASKISFMWHMPFDIDPVYRLGVRIYTNNGAGAAADKITWRLIFDIIKNGSALTVANTQWDTVLISGNGTAFANQRTPREVIDLSSLTRNNIQDGVTLSLELELSAVEGSSTAANSVCLGLEVDYVPQKCVGEGSTMERSLLSTGIE